MTETVAWRPLTAAGPATGGPATGQGGLILAVDFDTTGRPEARFSDLVANLAPGYEVRETLPPSAGTADAASGEGYVAHWAREIERDKPRVRALLGFCAGSVYAAALAERITAWQEAAPRLILFDPELIRPQSLMWQFHKVVGFMAGVISDAEIAEARAAGQRVYDETTEVAALKDGLMRLVREIGDPAFARAGLDKPRREELLGVFDAFMSYLAAASDIDPGEAWRSAVAYSSASPLSGLNGMRSAGLTSPGEALVGEEIRIETEHATMLADKNLAIAVSELLGPA
jgi:hypothetical protein